MSGGAVLRGALLLCSRRLVFPSSAPGPCHSSAPGPCHYPPWTVVSFPGRTLLHLGPSVCAGHNKWSKVKNIKGPKDAARNLLYMKLGLLIRIAVRDGGPNPDGNVSLAQAVEYARSKDMPKANIEAAIKGAADRQKSTVQQTYEARGPGGCLLLIEILTDNNTRSHNEIQRILKNHGGTLSDAARHNFDRKGIVVARGEGVTSDRALELAIEAGAEDVQETQDEDDKRQLQFVCDLSEMRRVRSALEELDVQTVSAGMAFVSHTPTLLPLAQLESASALLEELQNQADVVRVWDNIQAQS